MPPRKRACLSTPTPGFEIGESSAASAARQPGPTESDLKRCRVEQAGYRITDTMFPEEAEKVERSAPTVGRLAIGPVTVEANLLPTTITTTTTRGARGQMKGVSLDLNVEFKDTTRVSAQS
nr:hypothetical protein [Tanacetum cinerariifolium]